jgi:hypothetical protein
MATASTPTQAQVSSYHSRRQAVTPMYIYLVRTHHLRSCMQRKCFSVSVFTLSKKINMYMHCARSFSHVNYFD